MKSTKLVDDTHARWEHAPASDKEVWDYFDQVIVPQIIREAIARHDVTLDDLYHALSVARLKCEWVKQKKPTSRVEIEYFANSAIDLDTLSAINKSKFGCAYVGEYYEPTVFTSFGTDVGRLSNLRLRARNLESNNTRVGLSILKEHSMYSKKHDCIIPNVLLHPPGIPRSTVKRLEHDFQQLLRANNLFEFLQIVARLSYELSNFPPNERGTAAINSWIIDNMFREKFKMTGSIRPLLYDWTAFYESPEQYKNFYIISATVAIIKMCPGLYEQNREFYDSLRDVMQRDPNDDGNYKKRHVYWDHVKNHIKSALDNGAVDTKHVHLLQQIYHGELKFTEPSSKITALVAALSAGEKDISSLIKRLEISDQYLSNLIWFHEYTIEEHLGIFGNSKEELRHATYWADLGKLRRLDCVSILQLKKYLQQPVLEAEEAQKSPVKYNHLPLAILISHTTEDELDQIPEDFRFLMDPDNSNNKNISGISGSVIGAIFAGGLCAQDLAGLTERQVADITSRVAIALYGANKLITYRDLLGVSTNDTENNILRLIAKHFCHEDDIIIDDKEIRSLIFFHVELFRIGALKLSELKDKTVAQVQLAIVQAYFKYYFEENNLELDEHHLNESQIDEYHYKTIFIKSLLEGERDASMFLVRKMLKTCNIKASVMLQMKTAEISELYKEMRRVTEESGFASFLSLFANPSKRLEKDVIKKYHDTEKALTRKGFS